MVARNGLPRQVKPRRIACHDEKETYGAMAEEWSKGGRDWMDEATARLNKTGKPSESMAKAEAILLRLKFSVPAHNILLFKEEKEAFDEAAAAAEK